MEDRKTWTNILQFLHENKLGTESENKQWCQRWRHWQAKRESQGEGRLVSSPVERIQS
jgi:hypothetical protein